MYIISFNRRTLLAEVTEYTFNCCAIAYLCFFPACPRYQRGILFQITTLYQQTD